MRKRSWRVALLLGTVFAWPPTGQAKDYMAAARDAMQHGDLKSAALELRNAVRADPQNGEARLSLAGIELQLGDPAATERDARAAELRGADPHKTLPLIAQAILSQGQPERLLREMNVTGKDATLDAMTLGARGDAQIALGRLDEAGRSFADAEVLRPSLVAVWLADARLAMVRGDKAGAEAKLDRALAQQPGSLDARLLKAQMLRAKGDVTGAVTELDAILKDAPAYVQAQLERAALLIGEGKLALADADLDVVLPALPGNGQALYLKAVVLHERHDDRGADAILEKLSGLMARFPRGYLLDAAVKQALGQLQLAAESAEKFNAREPADLGGAKLLAAIQFQLGHPERAIEPLQHALAAGRPEAQALMLLGRAYGAAGQPNPAIAALQNASDLEPRDVAILTQLAMAQLRSGQPGAARTTMERAFAIAPKQASLARDLFVTAVATGELNQAGAVLAEIRAAQGDTALTRDLDGSLKLARLDLEAAREEFAGIVRDHPDFAPASINLARVLGMEGRNAEAAAVLRAALEKNPTAEPALGLLTAGMLRAGRAADAIALMQRAHDAAPSDPALQAGLAGTFIRIGKPEQALDFINALPAAQAATPALMLLKASAELALRTAAEGARDPHAVLGNPATIRAGATPARLDTGSDRRVSGGPRRYQGWITVGALRVSAPPGLGAARAEGVGIAGRTRYSGQAAPG